MMRNRIAKNFHGGLVDSPSGPKAPSKQMDPLVTILMLSRPEREARGLVHTPQEIFQQPDTWWRSYENLLQPAPQLERFLKGAGVFSLVLRYS